MENLNLEIIIGIIAIIATVVIGILQLKKSNKVTNENTTKITQNGSNNTQTNNVTNNHG
jgi:FtsZ-interacting cell division protein ZipA